MEKKKEMSPLLIVILTVLGTCLVWGCVFLGMKYFREKGNTTNPGEEAISFTCDNEVFDISKNSVTSYSTATGWEGSSAGIEYTLTYSDESDKKLTYTTWIETCYNEECEEMHTVTSKLMYTDYTCEYLLESSNNSGLCYSNGKFYNLYLLEENINKSDVNSIKPLIEEITENCKMN